MSSMKEKSLISHNIETVRDYHIRSGIKGASYKQSLIVLKTSKLLDALIYTKSSIMLGLGETDPEVTKTLKDLRKSRSGYVNYGPVASANSYTFTSCRVRYSNAIRGV